MEDAGHEKHIYSEQKSLSKILFAIKQNAEKFFRQLNQ